MTEQTLTAPAAAAPAQVTAPPLQARPQRTSTLRRAGSSAVLSTNARARSLVHTSVLSSPLFLRRRRGCWR